MAMDRYTANTEYQSRGRNFVMKYNGKIPHIDRLCRAYGCLEQLGRMVKTEMEAATILEQAKIAADALNAGRKVKQVEKYLRHGRTTGEWDESLLTATTEAATNTTKPVEGLTPSDLIAINSMLEAFADDNDTMAKALEKEGRIKPGEWYDPYYAMKRTADTARMYADKVKAAFEAATGEKYPNDEEPTYEHN